MYMVQYGATLMLHHVLVPRWNFNHEIDAIAMLQYTEPKILFIDFTRVYTMYTIYDIIHVLF